MPLTEIHGSAPLPEPLRNGVLALGNFDGVHLGHQALIAEARQCADGGPVGVMTFEPHPRAFFNPDQSIFPLTPGAQKAAALERFGVDFLWTVPFDHAFSKLTAEAFVKHYLVGLADVAHAVAGFNFHFGNKRGGSPTDLEAFGKALGFGVSIVEPFGSEKGLRVSSSAIRDDLAAGRIADATAKLGRPWSVVGQVHRGAQIGTGLGFPTANITLHPDQALHHGIYAVRVRHGDRLIDGAAYFGKRPTFDNGRPVLEVFLFDFDGDLYDQDIAVMFIAFIRPDAAFTDGDALADQMAKDCEAARVALGQA